MVRVKAQVMTRDESTGGWVPLGRGGMSVVGLRRLTTATDKDVTTEYRLHGQRIADQSVGDSYDCTRLASVVTAFESQFEWCCQRFRQFMANPKCEGFSDPFMLDSDLTFVLESLLYGRPIK